MSNLKDDKHFVVKTFFFVSIFVLICSVEKSGFNRFDFTQDHPRLYLIQKRLPWQLVIGNWSLAFRAKEHNAMLCLSDRQTIASHCAIAQ